jgi:magnesium-transporting ATPase (P-type)
MEFHPGDAEHARWLAYTALAVGQAVRAYANRSLRQSIFALRPNRFLALAVVAVVAVQLAIPALPVLAEAFHASVLSAAEWGIVALIAVAPAVVAEMARRMTGRDWVA